MPICSYLVVPEQGALERVNERLMNLAGCEVARAENRDVMILSPRLRISRKSTICVRG